ncbi:unnamed protein product [Chondrus crispus]|uniref:rRNA-processing protein FYV7 n=1 Tax=Chondrus crispus TaxID=2769 RepID=R7Q4N4_CHOCR|nr:unnamed protein product [Chondrus crispus]CDF32833.1 unnamed protein product [Chondrus crispus]|eukprot:XP_005712634.1 unnamed protein product [Chondrus crispus]
MNDEIQPAQKQEPEEKSIPSVVVEKRKPKKYLPFTKQMKQAEQARKERQKNEKEREIKIKTRENRLKLSKKERRKRSKLYRKVTTKGQPLLKHKLDMMLSQIQGEQ